MFKDLAGFEHNPNGSMYLIFMDKQRLWCDLAPSNVSKIIYNYTKSDLYCQTAFPPPEEPYDRGSSIAVGTVFAVLILVSGVALCVGSYKRDQKLRREGLLAQRPEYIPRKAQADAQAEDFCGSKPAVQRHVQQGTHLSSKPSNPPAYMPYVPKRNTVPEIPPTSRTPMLTTAFGSNRSSFEYNVAERPKSSVIIPHRTSPMPEYQDVKRGTIELKPLPYALRPRYSEEDARRASMRDAQGDWAKEVESSLDGQYSGNRASSFGAQVVRPVSEDLRARSESRGHAGLRAMRQGRVSEDLSTLSGYGFAGL